MKIWILLYLEHSVFPNSWKRWKIGLYFQISPNSLKSWKSGILELSIFSYFVKLWDFQACVGKGEPIYNKIVTFQVKKCLCNNIYATTLCQFKSWKYCLQPKMRFKICKISMGMTPRWPAAVFGRSHNYLPGPCLSRFFKCAIIFSLCFINADCFALGIEPGDTFFVDMFLL